MPHPKISRCDVYTVTIQTGTAPFNPPGPEVARILRELADKLEYYLTPWLPSATLEDLHGNKVGFGRAILSRKSRRVPR